MREQGGKRELPIVCGTIVTKERAPRPRTRISTMLYTQHHCQHMLTVNSDETMGQTCPPPDELLQNLPSPLYFAGPTCSRNLTMSMLTMAWHRQDSVRGLGGGVPDYGHGDSVNPPPPLQPHNTCNQSTL
jgi:hypothetical protein